MINVTLRHHTKAVILGHNHPSGETEPSRADIDMTAKLIEAQGLASVTLHGNLIVARNDAVSLKSLRLL